jgi:hypothetical protein
VIPNPPLTNLIREARDCGCVALDGLGMLVNQGVIGIRLWTERNLRPEVMRQGLKEASVPDGNLAAYFFKREWKPRLPFLQWAIKKGRQG